MPTASHVAHVGLPFANPMSEAAVDRTLRALRLPEGARVLETGCGSGELLLRVLERDASWSGLGIDRDPDEIAEARRRAVGRLPGRDLAFEVADAASAAGTFDAVLNVASSHAHGGFPAALGALRALLAADGMVVFGEGYWLDEPSAAFLDALGGATANELADLGGLRRAIAAAGFTVAHEEVASDADWAGYEHALVGNAERHGGADTAAYAQRITERRALPGGTSTLGFALFALRHG